MRTTEQIDNIKASVSDPFEVKDFLTASEISHLINLFNVTKENVNSPAVYKNTGPVTLDLNPFLLDPVIDTIVKKLTDVIGPYKITAAFFFSTDYPHIIHNDDTFELPDNVYKAITIPLEIRGDRIPKLCFFDQFYFHGPAKFFRGGKDIPTYYNKQLYDYKDVDGISEGMLIDESTRVTYLTHLKSTWLTGLTLWGTFDWRPGNILVFDSTRLHCASDFRSLGIKSKLGISIFTKAA